ncbi:hypothetical protein DOE73_06910 [Paenibacillus dendritiformis]|nr:hypothetical protein DOE73_06910 [Paenibacillus dendritiformis]
MQNRVNVKLWNLAALLLLLSLPLTASPPISIAAEQDEVDIFMEGIPVYGTVSISATAGAGAWGSHGTFVEGRQGGLTRTGWLTIQAILSYKTPQPNIRTPLPST